MPYGPDGALLLSHEMSCMGSLPIRPGVCHTADLTMNSLAAVNFFLGCVGVTQVSRIFLYQQSLKNETAGEVARDSAIDAKDTAKGIAQNPESAAKEAVQ